MSMPLFHKKLVLVFSCKTESLKVKNRSVGYNLVCGPRLTTLSPKDFLGAQRCLFLSLF